MKCGQHNYEIHFIQDIPFKCLLCPAGYKTASQLTKHMNSKHIEGERGKAGECKEMCGDVHSQDPRQARLFIEPALFAVSCLNPTM